MINVAIINIHEAIKKQGLNGKMTIQVNDELVFDVPKAELPVFKELAEKHMKNALAMSVPIVVELGEGSNWLEAH